jgi:hypothetical protein
MSPVPSGAPRARGRAGAPVQKRLVPDPVFAFPRDFTNFENGWLYAQKQGLFDVKPIEEMVVVESASYGVGSLIYANVHLRPVDDVFNEGWPVLTALGIDAAVK